MNKNASFIVSGPSGGGKTTLVEHLLTTHPEIGRIVTITTREPRKKKDGTMEQDGVDYNFTSKQNFEEGIEKDKFLEYALVYGNYYGSSREEVTRMNERGEYPLWTVDVQGAMTLSKKLENSATIFVCTPTMEALRARLDKRGDDPEVIKRRLAEAPKEIDIGLKHFKYVVVNGYADYAKRDISEIADHELYGIPFKNYKAGQLVFPEIETRILA